TGDVDELQDGGERASGEQGGVEARLRLRIARRLAHRLRDIDVGDGDAALQQRAGEGAVAEAGDDGLHVALAQRVEQQQQTALRAAELTAWIDEENFHARQESKA